MAKHHVLITRQIPVSGLDMLRDTCDLEMWHEDSVVTQDWLLEHIGHADGLLCLLTDQIDKSILDTGRDLKVVSTMAVGFDHIDVTECTRRGIPVGHTPGVLTETTADFAFALLMAAARRVVEGSRFVQQGHWTTWSPTLFLGQDLHSGTLGIVGFGRIGQAVAKRAKGFDMRVIACGASRQKPILTEEVGSVEWVDFYTLLAESDFVSLHVPLTKETHHLIGKTELQRMKSSSILINTSRGSVIDSEALALALVNEDIAYAALDVTEPEPIPQGHALLGLPNCIIFPHIASASIGTRGKMAIMAAENLLAGLSGKRLPFVVNPEVYDRG